MNTLTKRILVALTALAGVIFIFAVFSKQKPPPPTNFEECTNFPGSIIQESYPAVCVTKDGKRFVQPLTEEGEKKESGFPEGKFCGGIMGLPCPEGFTCILDGNYPDAGGKCVRN